MYDLDTQHIEESVTGPVPLTAIGENTNPVPHLYHPLLKKDLWLALGVIFNAMEEDVLRMLFSVRGHCQVLAIIKNTLENKDPGEYLRKLLHSLVRLLKFITRERGVHLAWFM